MDASWTGPATSLVLADVIVPPSQVTGPPGNAEQPGERRDRDRQSNDSQGCDRAGAKDFGGNRTIFGPRGPSVPMTNRAGGLKMRRFLGELGVTKPSLFTKESPRWTMLPSPPLCWLRPSPPPVAADTPTPPRDLPGRTADRRLPRRRTHALGLPPVRDPTPGRAPRTRADHRRVDLQPPRARRPPPHARPPPLRRRLVSTSRQDPQPLASPPCSGPSPCGATSTSRSTASSGRSSRWRSAWGWRPAAPRPPWPSAWPAPPPTPPRAPCWRT